MKSIFIIKNFLFHGGWKTKGDVTKWNRFLFEIRLYRTSEESMFRALIWFITLMVGAYSYYHLKKPELSIQNYIIMAAAYYADLHCNKLTQEVRRRYWRLSNLCNMLLWIVTVVLFAMGIVQLLDLGEPALIRGALYYTIMIGLAIIMIGKPILDSFLLGIFPESFVVLYVDPDSQDESIVFKEIVLDDAYKQEIETAGTPSPLLKEEKE